MVTNLREQLTETLEGATLVDGDLRASDGTRPNHKYQTRRYRVGRFGIDVDIDPATHFVRGFMVDDSPDSDTPYNTRSSIVVFAGFGDSAGFTSYTRARQPGTAPLHLYGTDAVGLTRGLLTAAKDSQALRKLRAR
jgi:hypothetical protein